jgi:hypothetical protein
VSARRKVAPIELVGRLAVRVSELSVLLGVSENTARQIVPELQCVYLGGVRLIPVSEVTRWLREAMRKERDESQRPL